MSPAYRRTPSGIKRVEPPSVPPLYAREKFVLGLDERLTTFKDSNKVAKAVSGVAGFEKGKHGVWAPNGTTVEKIIAAFKAIKDIHPPNSENVQANPTADGRVHFILPPILKLKSKER